MMDLFSYEYPDKPGFKARDTSRDAAAKAEPASAILRAQCFSIIRQRGPITADECAAIMDKSVLSIRPRFSELAVYGSIKDSGTRHKNASGRSAIAWEVM
jgi:predicted HTH transcriptional regulator